MSHALATLDPLTTPPPYIALSAPERPAAVPGPRARRRLVRPVLGIAIISLVLLAIAALVPWLLTSGDPLAADSRQAFLPPDGGHWLGTDENGRDVLTRLIYGVRPSLIMGVSATAIAIVAGAALGFAAGLGGKIVDALIGRCLDTLMAFPEMLLALVVITFWGQGMLNAVVAIGLATLPRNARMVRAQTQIVRRSGYVEAARTLGQHPARLIWRHVLPNALKPVLVLAPISVGGAIAAGAALSFLGFGAPPPAPEWGAMLSIGRNFLATAWWLVAGPAIAITVTVLAITCVGRAAIRRSEGLSA